MSVKQDCTYARTAQDIERKYNFGKTFADMLGLINDNRDKVDSVESSLRDEITETATTLKRDTEQVSIEVAKIVTNGVDRVTTKTGYTFNSDGLNITKSGEAMSNLLDYSGMYVRRQNGTEILTANHEGVNATNLHAKTYLIIGKDDGRSRFEDYGMLRTGCFWIGG